MKDKQASQTLKRYVSAYLYETPVQELDQALEQIKQDFQGSDSGSELDRKVWMETKQALEWFLAEATDQQLKNLVENTFNFNPVRMRISARDFVQRIYDHIFASGLSPASVTSVSHADRSGFKETINRNEYEWIEIPAGKFVTGISPEQVKAFQERIRNEQNYDLLSPKEQVLLESAVAKNWREDKGRLTSEEAEVVGSPYKAEHPQTPARYIYEAEVIFKSLPKEQVQSLDVFYVTRYPVTDHQFHPFEQSRSNFKMGESTELFFPKIVHRRKDVDAFCAWVGARLPSPLEWEKAGRGPQGFLYPWGNPWDPSRGNFSGESGVPGYPSPALRAIGGLTTRVNAYPQGASPYGVMDMAGNVREFTSQPGVAKGCNGRYASRQFLWAEHLLARETSDVSSGPKDALCFRLVLDQRERQLWLGFQEQKKRK